MSKEQEQKFGDYLPASKLCQLTGLLTPMRHDAIILIVHASSAYFYSLYL
jgi:hypothetical protein